MSRQAPVVGRVLAAVLVALSGCQPQQPFYLRQVDSELAHYKGAATEIEYPDVETDRLADVAETQKPFSLMNKDLNNIWELTLEEAMQIALQNNKVMRSIGGQVQGPPDYFIRNPEMLPTIYTPALAESNPRTGPEAALSAFDAQWATSVTWQKMDTPQNLSPAYQIIFPTIARDDMASFQTRLSKMTATGGQWALTHNVNYDLTNKPTVAYPASWNVNLEASWRQPLLQGAGVQFNRIAGPGATPGVYNGVVLARINTDVALADFEAAVRNLVSDVEITYWELYFAYRSLDAVKAGYESALVTWRRIDTLYRIGSKGGEAEKEAQARQQVYQFRSAAEQSLTSLYATEAKLRYMLGLTSNDGRLIRPKDEPTMAKVSFDWHEVLQEGLARSVELREQKWIVKRRELELIAAKNFLLPKVDFVALYRFLGLGNNLLPRANNAGSDFTQINSNAYQSLTSGDFQEWQLGFQASIPLGFRREMAGVRNAQLALAQEQVKLQEAELELTHQMAYAIRDLEGAYVQTETSFNRRVAAQREVEAVAAAYETDTITLDVLLQAQQRLAQAESDYFRALVNYAKAISQVHFRKGSLLEYNGVYLAEGPWPGKAYFDARRRARARAASTYLDYGFTQPRVISRGPIEQQAGGALFEGGAMEPTAAPTPAPDGELPVPTPAPLKPELLPTPEPLFRGDAPDEPQAIQPASDAQAATSGAAKRGWRAAKTATAAAPIAARPAEVADDWTPRQKAKSDEPRANPSTASVDRSASGWKRVQR